MTDHTCGDFDFAVCDCTFAHVLKSVHARQGFVGSLLALAINVSVASFVDVGKALGGDISRDTPKYKVK